METKPSAEVCQVFRVGGSLVIALPKHQLLKHGQGTGDYLVVIRNRGLTIFPVHEKGEQSAKVLDKMKGNQV